MSLYPSLPLILVAAGLALLAAIAYLMRLVRQHRRSLGALLKLAQTSHEPLELPAAAWPALNAGGIERLEYAGLWFGQPVHGEFGMAPDADRPFPFKITADEDIRLDFRLYSKTNRGEARLFAENLAGVFRLLLETAVHSKMAALTAALSEQARLSLYLQHDLRNLAQWVEWLAVDFTDAADDSHLLWVAQRLRTSAPHAAARAKHILNATCKTRAPPVAERVNLLAAILQSAEHAGIAVQFEQAETARNSWLLLRRDLLDRTLDNLFNNVAPLLRSEINKVVSISLTTEANKIVASIQIPRLDEVAQLAPEKLFEPFASGRPGGLGLGLYQAHKSVRQIGGELIAEICDQNICFQLSLPTAPDSYGVDN